jgi:hypothetical protein
VLAGVGCGVFNPAFLNVIDPTGSGGFATIDNAPGHVIVAFLNNATVSERLVAYLESPDGGNLDLTDLEKRLLRPRIRFRYQITFQGGTTQEVEFVSGSTNLIDSRFDGNAFPDLNENTLQNTVVICDVARLELLPGSQLEIFMPVSIEQWEQRDITGIGGTPDVEFTLIGQIPPQFIPLEVDVVDDDGNTVLRQNIGVRDVPAPIDNLFCGSVVAITATGELAVPFLDEVSTNPSYDVGDMFVEAAIGGRFEFRVTAQ